MNPAYGNAPILPQQPLIQPPQMRQPGFPPGGHVAPTTASGTDQLTSSWPQQPLDTPGLMVPPPPNSSSAQLSQGMLNGNYQQQLTTSMSGLSMNPLKQSHPAVPQTNAPFSNANIPPPTMSATQSIANGPPPQLNQQQQNQQNQNMPINNNYTSSIQTNGSPIKHPMPSAYPAPSSTPNSLSNMGMPQQPAAYPAPTSTPSSLSNMGMPPQPFITGGSNQMSINSSSVAGLPHMPPPKIGNQLPVGPSVPGQGSVNSSNGAPFQHVGTRLQGAGDALSHIDGSLQSSTGSLPPSSGPLPPSSGPLPPTSNSLLSASGNLPPTSGPLRPAPIVGNTLPPTTGPLPPTVSHLQPAAGPLPPAVGQLPSAGGPLPPAVGQLPSTGGPLPPSGGPLPTMASLSSTGPISHTGVLPPGRGTQPQLFAPSVPSGPIQLPTQTQQMPPRPGQVSGPPKPLSSQPPMGTQPPLPVGNNLQTGMPPMPGQVSNVMPGYPPKPQQHPSYPPQPGYPPQQQGYPPQQTGYPPQPTPQQPGYPPQQPGYPPQQPGYPPQPTPQQPGYPPQQPGYQGQMMPPQMPSRPGYNQPPTAGGMYQQPQYHQAPQPQQHRLDPDQMPNPIQVMIENQQIAGGTFVTNKSGLLPPLVTTKYIVQDQGNSSPRYLRSSLYCVPSTSDLIKTTALPFSLIVSPFARVVDGEYEPPIVDFAKLGPIRCNRCKAYMSPNMQFIDAGRRFQCLMCKVTSEVPTEYFQHLDHTGQRVDKYERPELVLGTYEFLATTDYCRNNAPPQIPAFVFIIDVSYNTVKSGLIHLLCSQIKTILKNLPIDQGQDKSVVRVGFITYNSSVHFYNIKSTLAQPQMMVVGDVQDMFMPLLDGFLCNPEESEAVIDALMEQIPKMFIDTKETETILYPAIQAGYEALKASNCSGKLLIFNSSLPIADAPGKLKNRDDRKLLGTEKEKTVLTPQCQSYNTLGQECVQIGCSVDLFLFNNSYIDIATIGQICRLTGGEVYKYTYFQADTDGKRLIADIIKNVSRPIAFDAVMRVRTSAGIRATDFYGHFYMANTTDMDLASIDANKSIAIEIKHDDKLAPEENVYLQIALLYTSCGGQRRLRIFNLALTVSAAIADVFKSCDLDAIMLFYAKQACVKLMELTPKVVKENVIHRAAQTLACYRKYCTAPTSAGQLILPECLKMLPLYVSCLLKNDAISGGSDMTLDDRSYVIQFVLSMDLNMSVNFLYPRFIPIHNVEPDDTDLPLSIRCTHEKMSEDGAYILENGVYLFVWLGQSLPQSFIEPLFGVQCTQQVNSERFAITGDTPLARRVRGIIETIMDKRTRCMRVTCVRQNDKLESVFRHFLIEDRGTDGSASYVDFLCHMHKEIKDLLS